LLGARQRRTQDELLSRVLQRPVGSGEHRLERPVGEREAFTEQALQRGIVRKQNAQRIEDEQVGHGIGAARPGPFRHFVQHMRGHHHPGRRDGRIRHVVGDEPLAHLGGDHTAPQQVELIVGHPSAPTAGLGTERQKFVSNEAGHAIPADDRRGVLHGGDDVAGGYPVGQLEYAPVDIRAAQEIEALVEQLRDGVELPFTAVRLPSVEPAATTVGRVCRVRRVRRVRRRHRRSRLGLRVSLPNRRLAGGDGEQIQQGHPAARASRAA